MRKTFFYSAAVKNSGYFLLIIKAGLAHQKMQVVEK